MKYSLKIVTLLFFVLSFNNLKAQQNDTSTEDYFNGLTQIYDNNFEQALIDLGIDDTLNGYVKTENIKNITELNVANKNISDLTGIENFTSLQKLFCQNNNLRMIDLYKLISLSELNCSNNNLIALDPTNNTNLTVLYCNNNALTHLNLFRNNLLTIIECDNNDLKYINLKNINNNAVQSFKSLNNPNLVNIDVNSLNNITSDWQKDTQSSFVQNRTSSCNSTVLINDANFRAKLIQLGYTFNGNNLCLDGPNTPANEISLDLSVRHISDLTGIEAFTNLITLDCSSNQLNSLNVAQNTHLTQLRCYNNQLQNLDVTQNTDLTLLNCYYNRLSSLDLTQNTDLTSLSCGYNQLSSIDLTQNTDLVSLMCLHQYNHLQSLDITHNIHLKYVNCKDNNLCSIDLRGLNEIIDFRSINNEELAYISVDNPNDPSLDSWQIDETTEFTTADPEPCPSSACENPYTEYGYDFDTNEVVIILSYDEPSQYDSVNQWIIQWGNAPNFDPEINTPVGSFTVDGPIMSNDLDASGNYVIRIQIPYTEIYDPIARKIKYSFHILTKCDNGSSDWSYIGNSFKYITGFECISSDSVQVNFSTLTQPISQFRIIYGPQGFNPNIEGEVISTPLPPPAGGPQSIIITGLSGISYDFYIQRVEDFGTSGYNLLPYTFNMKDCASEDTCQQPTIINITVTDTTVYFTWDDSNPNPEPGGGWEVEYGLQGFADGEGIGSITVYEPEILIEDLIPANAYEFRVRSICSSGDSSEWATVLVNTTCTNCTSFKPQVGKDYVISGWVKENWATKPTVTMIPEMSNIKSMLNNLVARYNNNLANNIAICPNGTVEPIQALIDNDVFHPELLETQPQPAIYNFRYNKTGSLSRFEFQFTEGEYLWSDNLVVNPGAELGVIGWTKMDGTTNNMEFNQISRDQGNNSLDDQFEHSGQFFFSVGGDGYNHDYHVKQDISVSNPDYLIDNGNCSVELKAYLRSFNFNNDKPNIKIDFLDSVGGLLSSFPTTGYYFVSNKDWQEVHQVTNIPIRTKTIRIELFGDYMEGTDNDSYFDDISLKINYPVFDDLSPIQTFDTDCYNFNTGVTDHVENIELEDPDHYPNANNFYKLFYNCGQHVKESKYRYGKGVFKSEEETIPINQQVYSYDNSYIQLSFFDEDNIAVPNADGTEYKIFKTSGDIIDEWQRIQGTFKAPAGTVKIKIELVNKHISDAFFDDIRVFPKDGNMKSFVYDQVTQKLMAELDENNYATFYEYDKEGGLIRVKKETEKGVFTIQETRSGNTKK